ncbi:MAG: type I restriction enzyme HsdR N-terminal domain-containing protein [Desulfobacterales bacterium]|nr:type I restriction enzyme HsdR N-terminal domain-containing protein [Desulfobacterales bacterium]
MSDIPTHHIVYGLTADFITGEQVVDTDDERLRQKLARFLVAEKNYAKAEIEPRLKIETMFAGQFVTSGIDFTIRLHHRRLMIIRYGPGSLVTRERPAIAAARVLEPEYRIPLAVVTNGRDAELLDTHRGKVLASGLDSIPDRARAEQLLDTLRFEPFADPGRRERELRILNAFDIEVCCVGGPCALPSASEG